MDRDGNAGREMAERQTPRRASRISRRSFLAAAGTGAAAASLGPLSFVVPYAASVAHAQGAWDAEADVVVVGSGAAAFTAAITAAESGANVIMLEKAPAHGGTTAKSGGGYWTPNNRFMRERGLTDERPDALRYMARYSFPQLYNPADPTLGIPARNYELISTFYDTASEAVDFLGNIGAVQSTMQLGWNGKPPPDYFEHAAENKAPRGRLLQPITPSGTPGGGTELIRQLKAAADDRGIQLLLGHRVQRLVRNSQSEVVGLEATTQNGQTVTVRARKAVVFGSGGFTHNRELVLNFQRGPMFGGCAVPTNEGDFVSIGEANGARLGNMNSAFRAQLVVEQALNFSSVPSDIFFVYGDSAILVNRFGQRVVNEKRNYNDRTQVHFAWDPVRAEWPNLLLFWVYDERTATYWQNSYPLPKTGDTAPYVLKGGTLDELGQAIDGRLAELSAQTGGVRLDGTFAANFKQTVSRFNDFAKHGVDQDFMRGEFPYDLEWPTSPPTIQGVTWPAPDQQNLAMYPLRSEGPYYAIIVGAGTLDTNGGPVINRLAQVVDTAGAAIPGLYGAGNCIANPGGPAYWGGGSTLGPAITYGYIAGLNAASESIKVA